MINEQSKFFCELTYPVRYSEMDYNKVLKPSAFLNDLQDLATVAADRAGFGYNEVTANNCGWFLLKYHMEFDNYPKDIENITVKTEARGYNKLFAHRDFEIYSNGEMLGRVLSYWSLFDFEKQTLISPNSVFDFMPKVEKREDDLSFAKVYPVERVDYTSDFKVRFDDIDVNHHANNVNYIIWAFESLPREFRDNHKLKTLDMVFKKQIKYGNVVLSEAQVDGNLVRVSVKNKADNEELCVLEAEFVEF